MNEIITSLSTVLSLSTLGSLLKASLLGIAGFVAARLASRLLLRVIGERLSRHNLILLRRAVFYAILTLFLISALRELGFKLHVLLGAAGIFSVAIGFASQTSVSNLISGLFLLGEQPFAVGDVIKIGDKTGEVLSIDPLSVKLRTFDNLYVRIPNETLIKSEVTTLSKFPIRRFDLLLGVAYKEDIKRVKQILFDVADQNPLALEEPQPIFIFQGFGESSIDLQFSVWSKQENFLALKNALQMEIKSAFDEHGIEIPFPHRTLYTGSASEPFAVRMVVRPDADAEDSADK